MAQSCPKSDPSTNRFMLFRGLPVVLSLMLLFGCGKGARDSTAPETASAAVGDPNENPLPNESPVLGATAAPTANAAPGEAVAAKLQAALRLNKQGEPERALVLVQGALIANPHDLQALGIAAAIYIFVAVTS